MITKTHEPVVCFITGRAGDGSGARRIHDLGYSYIKRVKGIYETSDIVAAPPLKPEPLSPSSRSKPVRGEGPWLRPGSAAYPRSSEVASPAPSSIGVPRKRCRKRYCGWQLTPRYASGCARHRPGQEAHRTRRLQRRAVPFSVSLPQAAVLSARQSASNELCMTAQLSKSMHCQIPAIAMRICRAVLRNFCHRACA